MYKWTLSETFTMFTTIASTWKQGAEGGIAYWGIHMTLLSGGVSVELHEEIQEGQSAQRGRNAVPGFCACWVRNIADTPRVCASRVNISSPGGLCA